MNEEDLEIIEEIKEKLRNERFYDISHFEIMMALKYLLKEE